MGFLDFLKELFSNNKKNARIICNGLTKTYGEPEPLEIALYDLNNTALIGKTVTINVNGRDYEKITDSDGVARLNINLNPGEYTPLISFSDDEYNLVTAFTKIIIKQNKKPTRMEGTNINMTYKDGTKYQCAVYDDNGRVSGSVEITVNGVPYIRSTEGDGLAKLNINLNPGTYKVSSVFYGDASHLASSVENTIVVNKAPEPAPTPTPTPSKLYSYITAQGAGKLGQRTGYSCGPHSLMQCIYRLTGIELSETELMSVCGTTTSGTSHQGLETGLAWFNRKYGYNLKMTWKNFSEVGFDGLQKAYENGAVFLHLCYRSTWGHYEVPLTSGSNPNKILNSLGNRCGNGYCGYIESRSKSTQQSYINGISQKSVCIITRG